MIILLLRSGTETGAIRAIAEIGAARILINRDVRTSSDHRLPDSQRFSNARNRNQSTAAGACGGGLALIQSGRAQLKPGLGKRLCKKRD
jgi:hypothetical protein